jgi:hypothetical protein
MTQPMTSQDGLKLWHQVITRSLRELPYDLSQRQIGVLLSVYMSPPPHTVRNLAERLSISKPAICRALDALSRRMKKIAATSMFNAPSMVLFFCATSPI